MKCGNCKGTIPDGSKFCPVCGAPVQSGQISGKMPFADKARKGLPVPVIIAIVAAFAVMLGLATRPLRIPKEDSGPMSAPASGAAVGKEADLASENEAASREKLPEEGFAKPERTEQEVPPQPAESDLEPEPAPVREPSSVLKIDPNGMDSYMSGTAPESVWAFAVMDAADRELTGSSRSGDALSSSALLNIPLLYTCAVLSEKGIISLDTTIRIDRATSGRTALADKVGQSLSVRDLLAYMLQYSDNTASNTLLGNLTFKTINETCAGQGYKSVSVNNYILSTTDYTSNDNYVSCADLCGMLQELYSDRFSTIGSVFLQKNMVIHDNAAAIGIGKAAPSNAVFMNHNGQKMDKYNEAAIVDDGTHAYIIVFMGSKSKLEKMSAAAATCGEYVFGALGQQ